MAIKGESLTINLYAFNVANNLPASGLTDISGYIIKDGAAPAHLTAAISEPSAANMPGIYEIALGSADMTANWITIGGKSISNPTGVIVYPVMIATEQSFLPLISGYTDSLENNIAALPNASEIAGATTTSGNAAGWADGATAAEVWAAGTRELTDYKIDEIAGDVTTSGDAAGWGATATAPVTVSGYTAPALADVAGEVAASGNAEGWNLYSDATAANQTEILNRITYVSGLVAALNDPTVGQIVSGIFDEVVQGTKDFRTATIEIWAYTSNDVNLSGTASGVGHDYFDMAGSPIFSFDAMPSGRVRY